MEERPARERYKGIQELTHQYPVQLLCDLARVSRSGYYKWIKRQTSPSPKQLEDQNIQEKIRECHTRMKGIYGYRRVLIWLRRVYNLHINHKRVQR
ncbi:IS3 family transposase, partial [Priestia endophytica]